MKRFLIIFGMIVTLVGFTAVSQSGATAELELISGSSFKIISESSPGVANFFSTTFAGYSVVSSTGFTAPAVGSSALPVMDLSISGTGTGKLEVLFSQSGFTYSGPLTFFRIQYAGFGKSNLDSGCLLGIECFKHHPSDREHLDSSRVNNRCYNRHCEFDVLLLDN